MAFKMKDLRKDCLWRIECEDDGIYARNVMGERKKVKEEAEELHHGDVLAIRPNGFVRKLHDGHSSGALVYVTNQCNSNCIMCPDSVKMRTRPSEITSAFLAEFIALLPSDLEHVDITGGEPTLLKENLQPLIMQVCELEENAEVLMLSNGRSFASAKYTKQFAALAKKRFKIEIPIHSAKKEQHDRIAGCAGSFEQTRRGIHNLLENDIEVGVRVVVSKLNYQELDAIMKFISREFPQITYVNIMGMEVLGNAWKNKEIVWEEFDSLQPYLQEALEVCFRCGLRPNLYNFPLCLFDRKYWYCYKSSISGYKIRYFEACDACGEKHRCGGFFFSTAHQTNYKVRVQQ